MRADGVAGGEGERSSTFALTGWLEKEYVSDNILLLYVCMPA